VILWSCAVFLHADRVVDAAGSESQSGTRTWPVIAGLR